MFEQYPLPLYIALTYALPSFYALFFLKDKRLLKTEIIRNSWRLPLLCVVSVTGYYLMLKTFALTEASTAVPIVFTSTLLTAIGGIVILKEHSSIWQKLFSAIFVVVGVILLR